MTKQYTFEHAGLVDVNSDSCPLTYFWDRELEGEKKTKKEIFAAFEKNRVDHYAKFDAKYPAKEFRQNLCWLRGYLVVQQIDKHRADFDNIYWFVYQQ
jgi:hypothetical protein